MLSVSFFISAFSSIFWILYCTKFINWKALVQSSALESIYQAVFITLFPILLLWLVFALIRNYYTERRTSIFLYNLLDQVKKNTDTVADFGKSLQNTETELKNNIALKDINLLITDINEILSDIMKRANSISSTQLEHLWSRTAGGERWLMAKTFIEITDYQVGFIKHIKEKALKDTLLKGSLLEFISRYKTIQLLLKTNDKSNIFYNIIEYGALGKVFEILAPLAQDLSETKTPILTKEKTEKKEEPQNFTLTEESFSIPSFLSTIEEPQVSPKVSSVTPEKKEEPKIFTKEAPTIEASNSNDDIPPAPIISSFTQTQMALRNIKSTERTLPTNKEETKKTPVISLEELEQEINNSPENNYDEYAYPFGAWLNDKKN